MPALLISDVIQPATAQQWLTQLLSLASTLGLPTQSWQSGGVTRTMFAVLANLLSGEDSIVSMAAQGGFLDFAATGTVTFTNPNGQLVTVPVSPDPSIPAQWPTPGTPPLPGWLDFLLDSTYNVQRIQASNASGNLTFANTSGSPSTAYPIGQYHVANPSTGATYSNALALTIAASTNQATIIGATNASPIVIQTSAAHGLSTGQVIFNSGVAGNTAANGFFVVQFVDATHFSLTLPTGAPSSGNGAYTAGGTVWTTAQYPFAADLSGTVGSTGVNTITQPVTSLIGVSCTNFSSLVGTNVESNTLAVARARAKIQSLSPNGPKGAYLYFALTASQILSGQVLSGVQETANTSLLSTPITQALVQTNPATGTVTTTVANAGGAVSGVVGLGVTGATNATPIVVSVTTTAGLSNGMTAQIQGVQGNTAANGYWTLAGLTGSTFQLVGSVGNGIYTSGGTVEAGDLGLVDSVLQANCVPLAVTAITQSAVAQNVTIAATVYVPAAQAANVVGAIQNALANYQATVPIGGFASGVPTPNTLPFNEVLGVIEGAAAYIRAATLTLNGTTVDVAVGAANVVVFQPNGGSYTTAISVQTF